MKVPRDDEFSRQRALDSYHVLDSLPEDAYDDIVQLASAVCDVPIALVSLIDRDRQWFKASKGLEISQTHREVALCDHTIREPDTLMEVPDATLDPRFRENPLVTGEPWIRFYAGMPLVTPSGAAIGTVCVMDNEQRKLTPRQREAMASLARLTMNLLEGRNRERALERAMVLAPQLSAEPDTAAASGAVGGGYKVAILELQNHAGAVARLGRRAVEKQLQKLGSMLEEALRLGHGDALYRVSGSPEFVVVLQGTAHADVLQGIEHCLTTLRRDAGLTVLMVAADATGPDEALERVFQRADKALSDAKDRLLTDALPGN
jgi:GGDEF domain-containing protein